jgi:hypothetical protein
LVASPWLASAGIQEYLGAAQVSVSLLRLQGFASELEQLHFPGAALGLRRLGLLGSLGQRALNADEPGQPVHIAPLKRA